MAVKGVVGKIVDRGGDSSLLPTGTVTLLLGDIEGSTRLWQASGSDMLAWIAIFHDTVSQVVGEYGGVLPLEQGEGDSFVAAFDRGSNALRCAVGLQAADLGPLRLRIGVHTAEVHRRDPANYAGVSLSRCARLRDLGHGGQVLMSRACYAVVADDAPAEVDFRDLGVHRLRDLARPEHVYQLCHPHLRSEFPPLRSADHPRHNLPVPRTRLVGRGSQVAEVGRLVEERSEITLTGSGGCGKTRLALEVATRALASPDRKVYFVDLSPQTSDAGPTRALAETLAVREEPGRPLIDTLTRSIGNQDMLIVVDNCEHLIEPAARLVDALGGCPRVKVLATSRQALGVGGETTWRVPSLSLPADKTAGATDEGSTSEAVELFCDRAALVRPGFRLGEDNSLAVEAICRRLDGIPLAIELAAARTNTFTPAQIASRLDDRFGLLTGGVRTALPRQQTLQASVDGGYELLSEPEQLGLTRLSVFVGGFDMDAAESVVGLSPLAPARVADLVGLLVSKSLVLVDDAQPAARYRLLETVRDYAETKLRAGDGQAAVRDGHLAHFQRFAEEAEGRLFGADQAQCTARLEADDGNIRAALEWAAAGGDVAAGLRMVGNLHFHWWVTGRYRQGCGHARALLAAAGEVDPALHCGALIALGGLIAAADDIRAAIPPLQEGLALARAAGDRKSTARALNWLGNAMVITDPRAGLDLVDEAARLGAEVGDLFAQVDSTILSGWARAWTGDLIAAKVRFSAAAELARAAHQLSFQGEALASLCYPTICQGDFGAARHLADEAEAICRVVGHRYWLAACPSPGRPRSTSSLPTSTTPDAASTSWVCSRLRYLPSRSHPTWGARLNWPAPPAPPTWPSPPPKPRCGSAKTSATWTIGRPAARSPTPCSTWAVSTTPTSRSAAS